MRSTPDDFMLWLLFTGDHVAYSERRGALTGFSAYNRDGVQKQAASIAALASSAMPAFHSILPGHGRQAHFDTWQQMQAALLEAAETLKTER